MNQSNASRGLGEEEHVIPNDGNERNPQSNFPRSQDNPKHVPSSRIWTGNFEIRDDSNCVHYKGFLAHPATTISNRAYDFSKWIPGTLMFDLCPRHNFWPTMFQTRCPDHNDVALYFYARGDKESHLTYSGLLKRMVKDDLMLRSSIGDVQLLVFPSKLMPTNLQILDGCYFMWGVFLRSKRNFN